MKYEGRGQKLLFLLLLLLLLKLDYVLDIIIEMVSASELASDIDNVLDKTPKNSPLSLSWKTMTFPLGFTRSTRNLPEPSCIQNMFPRMIWFCRRRVSAVRRKMQKPPNLRLKSSPRRGRCSCTRSSSLDRSDSPCPGRDVRNLGGEKYVQDYN